jgi:hypothetical protein
MSLNLGDEVLDGGGVYNISGFFQYENARIFEKFKTFCLNSRATKFYPNLLASHLKLRIKLKHIKLFSNYGINVSWNFLGFYFGVFNWCEV